MPRDHLAGGGQPLPDDTLDTLYAQSDRLWHIYLSDVADMGHAVDEHAAIHDALRLGDADKVAALIEAHVKSFDAQVRTAVTTRLGAPLTRPIAGS